jgi:hypothetical protein
MNGWAAPQRHFSPRREAERRRSFSLLQGAGTPRMAFTSGARNRDAHERQVAQAKATTPISHLSHHINLRTGTPSGLEHA